jgi:hypothetical protein
MTVSVGISLKTPTSSWDAAIKQADVALYLAKEGGRNRVAWNPESEEAEQPGSLLKQGSLLRSARSSGAAN